MNTFWAWAVFVASLGACASAVVPFSDLAGFLKNFAVIVVSLILLMAVFAMFGHALHSFMLEKG